MQYKVEFLNSNLKIKSGETRSVANSIEGILNKYSSEGFELAQVAQISVQEDPGCLGGLIGQKSVFTNFNMLVFKK